MVETTGEDMQSVSSGTRLTGDPGVAVVTVRSRETTQNATYELLNILSQLTSVSLITTTLAPESAIHDSYSVTEISDSGTGRSILTAAFRFIRNQVRMCYAITKHEEEVVLFFGAIAYLLPVVFARLIGRTVIVEPRGDVPLTLQLQWEEQVPSVIARTLATGVRVFEYLGYTSASAIITYTPAMATELNLDRFDKKLHTSGARHVLIDEFRPKIEFQDRDRRVGYLGRLDVEKGIPILVEVVRHLPENIEFTFVGDGEYRELLEAELADEISTGQVEVTGWVDHGDVPDQLNLLKLLIMPSEPTEGLPSTILESFACGTPVYATPVSGIPDVIHDGTTGFEMKDTDPERIARRVVQIMERDDLSEISANCRSLIEEEYSFEATVTRYREMFTTILNQKQ